MADVRDDAARKFTEDRRQIAAQLEAEIIGKTLVEPWRPLPKGKIERTMGLFIRGYINEPEFRARLVGIKSAYYGEWKPRETREVYQQRWGTAHRIMAEFEVFQVSQLPAVEAAVTQLIFGQIDEAELRVRLTAIKAELA